MISLFLLKESIGDTMISPDPVPIDTDLHNSEGTPNDSESNPQSLHSPEDMSNYANPEFVKNLPKLNPADFQNYDDLMAASQRRRHYLEAGWAQLHGGQNPKMERRFILNGPGDYYLNHLEQLDALDKEYGGFGGRGRFEYRYLGKPATTAQKVADSVDNFWRDNWGKVGVAGLAGLGAGAYYLKNKKQQEALQGSSVSSLFRR